MIHDLSSFHRHLSADEFLLYPPTDRICADDLARSTARVAGCIIPHTEIATLVHEGSYSNVDMTYGALATYVARHALPLQGPIREYYLCGPQDTVDETAWRTEIGWPIFHTG
jgi:effector-binding domain-containing protein